jgi:hypothetical protein
MGTKAKTFDCLEMKRCAQEKLRAEYEARREEYASYSEFLAATINEDPWQQQLWQRISARPPHEPGQTQTTQ